MFQEISASMEQADHFFRRGHFGASEIICRSIFARLDANWREAFLLLADLPLVAGNPTLRRAHQVASSSPSLSTAYAAYSDVLAGEPQCLAPKYSDTRFLLVNARGNGLWSDASAVLSCALLAEITDRHLIVNWGENSFYSQKGEINSFPRIFSIPEPWKLCGNPSYLAFLHSSDNRAISAGVIEYCLDAYSILASNARTVVCCGYIGFPFALAWTKHGPWPNPTASAAVWTKLTNRYLPINGGVARRIDIFRAQLGGSDYNAYHIRGTDKIIEDQNLWDSNDIIIDKMRNDCSGRKILLISDDQTVEALSSKEFGDRLIMTDSLRTKSDWGVHRDPNLDDALRIDLASDVLLDTWLAVGAVEFLGNARSNVSAAIALLRPARSKTTLLNSNQLTACVDWNDELGKGGLSA